MAKIAEIKLTNAEVPQFIKFFLERIDKIHQNNSYYTDFFDDSIEHPTLEDKIFSIGYFGWAIYMNNQKNVGRIRYYQNSGTSILTFEGEEQEDPQSILEFAKFIQRQLKDSGFTITHFRDLTGVRVTTPEERNKIYVPKTEKTIKQWKTAYSIIKNMRKEAKNELYIPKLEDYRDRITMKMHVTWGEKTISRIIKAGDANRL